MIDYHHPPLWYCIVFAFYLAGLISLVRSGVRPKRELSPASYAIRVYGAGFLLLVALAGIVTQIWLALRSR